MNFLKLIVLSSIFLLLMNSCKKEIDLPNSDSEKLIGNWNWIHSSGGFSGGLLTPSSTGYQETIEFKKSGAFYKERDGQQVSYLSFSFFEGKSISSAGATQLIRYIDFVTGTEHSITQSFQFFGNDTLLLSEECHDCYGHLYVRD